MRVITVKKLNVTACKGDRFKASAGHIGGMQSITRQSSYDNAEKQVIELVAELVRKLGWQDLGDWNGGHLPNMGWVFVCNSVNPIATQIKDSSFQVRL